MESANIFEQASREALRFDSPKGQLTVEDLWHLPLTSETGKANLDTIGVTLQQELRATSETVSLVKPAPTGRTKVLQLKFDIVKHIIDVRVAERDAAAAAAERSAKKQKLMEVLARKEDQALETMSADDIRAAIAAL